MLDVIIIGGGILGVTTARLLSRFNLDTLVLEKGADLGEGASKANSAVLAAGFHPRGGSLKGISCVRGNAMYPQICKELGVEIAYPGSLFVAFHREGEEMIREKYKKGLKNNVPDMAILSGSESRALEPGLSDRVTMSLYARTTGIIELFSLLLRTAQSAEKNGVHFAFDEEVQEIIEHENHFEVVTGRRSLNARYVVNTAGGMAMAVESGVRPQDLIIKPRCGQFLVFDRQGKNGIRHVLYQAQETDEKGCLLAPSIEGNIIAGPTSQDVPDYKNVETTDWGIHHIEKTAKKILPELDMGKVITSFAGVRANIKNVVKEEKDFVIRRSVPRMVSALGIKNPGMTAAPYLCQMILDLLIEDGLNTAPNPDYCPVLDLPKPFLKQTESIQKKWYEQDHRYGNLVCRCEGITEGDILRVLREPLPPKNMNGLKKRLRTTMGRCQGSFCTPRILEILSREWSVPPEKIMKEAPGSPFVKGRVK